MRIVDVEAAQAELDVLIDQACAGEEIIISLDSVPVARLLPVDRPQRQGLVSGE
jgi:antitoxin (DNA-binding transcriptional repressor) of toxin-antitoxin stability system